MPVYPLFEGLELGMIGIQNWESTIMGNGTVCKLRNLCNYPGPKEHPLKVALKY